MSALNAQIPTNCNRGVAFPAQWTTVRSVLTLRMCAQSVQMVSVSLKVQQLVIHAQMKDAYSAMKIIGIVIHAKLFKAMEFQLQKPVSHVQIVDAFDVQTSTLGVQPVSLDTDL